jgi:predicted dehydrogenase
MNRRQFLSSSAAALPMIVPSRAFGANDRIQVGFIGVGGRGRFLLDYFPEYVPQAEVIAVTDCYLPRCYGKDPNSKAAPHPLMDRWAKYQDYREMLEKQKLDAVFIETCTHARVLIAIQALQAGLHVYAEKPVSLTVAEGRALANAVTRYNRVLQCGTQQRSMPINRYASELVRTGKIGKISTVTVCNFLPPLAWTPHDPQPVPDGLDWDKWCNQTELRPYHPRLQRSWGWWWDYDGGGQSWGVSGWGTHSLDQVQCALGTDDTGPEEIWTEDTLTQDTPDFPFRKDPGWGFVRGRKPVMMRYANGTLLKLDEPGRAGLDQLGAIFQGDQGMIHILRGSFTTDRPELMRNSPDSTRMGKGEDVAHLRNFMDCVRSRKKPNADIETAHRATTVCHLVNICRQLDRRLKWDPKAEKFIGDDEANGLLARTRRKGYELPKVEA